MSHGRTGRARRVTMYQARAHFEAGGSILVSEYGHEATRSVTLDTTTHDRTTTTFEELRELVNQWRGRHPNQRYYIVDWEDLRTIVVPVTVVVDVADYRLNYDRDDDVEDYTGATVRAAAAEQLKLLGWGSVKDPATDPRSQG